MRRQGIDRLVTGVPRLQAFEGCRGWGESGGSVREGRAEVISNADEFQVGL